MESVLGGGRMVLGEEVIGIYFIDASHQKN